MGWGIRVAFLALVLGFAICLFVLGLFISTGRADPAPPPAPSQPECQPRATTIAKARERWKEEPIFLGAASSGAALLITRSERTTWTAYMCSSASCCAVSGGMYSEFLKGA